MFDDDLSQYKLLLTFYKFIFIYLWASVPKHYIDKQKKEKPEKLIY